MLNTERFILLFLDWYFERTIADDGNNFQWKINVAMRSFLVFVVCFLPASCFLPSAPLSFFLLFIHSVLCSAFCSAFRLLCSFIPLNISSALPSFLPSFKHSFRYLLFLLCSSCSLLCSACSMGVLTLLQKNPNIISSLRKFPPFFQKFHPTTPYLTPH